MAKNLHDSLPSLAAAKLRVVLDQGAHYLETVEEMFPTTVARADYLGIPCRDAFARELAGRWNAHDALVAALEAYMADARIGTDADKAPEWSMKEGERQRYVDARAALALARKA